MGKASRGQGGGRVLPEWEFRRGQRKAKPDFSNLQNSDQHGHSLSSDALLSIRYFIGAASQRCSCCALHTFGGIVHVASGTSCREPNFCSFCTCMRGTHKKHAPLMQSVAFFFIYICCDLGQHILECSDDDFYNVDGESVLF